MPSRHEYRPRRRRARTVLTAAVALLCALPAPLRAQDAPRPSHHAVASWSTDDGLPSSSIFGIRQTPDGYLWLATFQGLVRFDGVEFRTYGDMLIPGLERGAFVALELDPSAALWAASESGELVRLEGRQWSVYGVEDGLPPDRISALALDGRGGLWVGSRLGVWQMRDGTATPLPVPDSMPAPEVVALARGSSGELWIGTVAGGILRHDGRGYTRLTTRDGLPSDRIDALHADADGTLWVGSYGDAGVTRIRDGRVTRLGARDATAPRRVRHFMRDRSGALWLAAENGLFVLQGERLRPVPLEPGVTTKVEVVFEDSEGHVWAGSRQAGLFRVRESSFAILAAADRLPHPFAFAVYGDGADGVWIGTQEGLVHRPHRGRADGSVAYGAASGLLPEPGVRDVVRDEAGDIWIAATGGLTRLPGGRADRAVTYTRRDGMADDRARSLALGRGGRVWVGTLNGVSEWHDGRLRAYGAAHGLSDGYVLSVFEDSRGTLWVGTQTAGLFRRAADGRFVPGPIELARQPIFRLSESPDGTLWVGTTRGLARLRGSAERPEVALLTTGEGLPGNTIFQALDDGRGGLWLTGPSGIARVPLDELERVAAGRARAVTARPFGRGDGLPASEASSISRSWRAPDGTLWFPTPAGVAVVDPALVRPRGGTPSAHVDLVMAGGTEFAPAAWASGPLALAPGTRTLEFRFTAPSFTAPQQLRFRYRLDGFDTEWQYAGTRRVASYTHLPPARYRFVVQARPAHLPWPGEGADDAAPSGTAEVPVELRAHVWETRWFAALVALLLVGAAALGHALRLRAARHDSARVAREEVLRAMSLRDDLTGLYNRRGLLTLAEQQVRAATRERGGFTLLFADVDGLKAINDTHGHAVGDRVITDAAALLRETFREADIIARLGGDEFVVLLPHAAAVAADAAGATDAADAARARLSDAVVRHNLVAGRPYALSLSLGTSQYDPARPCTMEELLADADGGMYAAKRDRQQQAGSGNPAA